MKKRSVILVIVAAFMLLIMAGCEAGYEETEVNSTYQIRPFEPGEEAQEILGMMSTDCEVSLFEFTAPEGFDGWVNIWVEVYEKDRLIAIPAQLSRGNAINYTGEWEKILMAAYGEEFDRWAISSGGASVPMSEVPNFNFPKVMRASGSVQKERSFTLGEEIMLGIVVYGASEGVSADPEAMASPEKMAKSEYTVVYKCCLTEDPDDFLIPQPDGIAL